MVDIVLPNGWRPRSYQMPVWKYFQNGGKRANNVWHRRSGKDDVALNITSTQAVQRPANYWYMLPESSQGRKAIWDAISPHTGQRRIDQAFPHSIRRRTIDNEMKIELVNGAIWQVLGSDNFNSYMGSPPAGVVFSEWALSNPQSWSYIQPILEENDGWALFNGTPRGRNHAADFYDMAMNNPDTWFCDRLGADKTGVFSKQQLDSIKAELCQLFGHAEGEARFMQEYYCSFDAALPGAYYGVEMNDAESEGRICGVPYDPAYPVVVCFDFGRGASNAAALVFIQVVGMEPRVIDYYEDNAGDVPKHCAYMRDKPYQYSHLVLPHDAEPKRYGTGVSYDEQFKAQGFKTKIMPMTPSVGRDINITRNFIKMCWFNKRKVMRLIECLRSYHRAWDSKKKTFDINPKHDWCLTGDTEILTRNGTYRIMDVPKQGEVLTSCGWKQYTSPRITRRNAPLVEVTFIDGLTVRCTPEHLFKTDKGWRYAEHLKKGFMILSSLTQQPNTSMESCTAYSQHQIDIFHVDLEDCIAWFGKMLSGIYLKGVISTIKMIIEQTIFFQISNACPQKSISPSHGNRIAQTEKNISPMVHGLKLLSGIDQKLDACGIKGTQNETRRGTNGRQQQKSVSIVRKILKALIVKMGTLKNIVQQNANMPTIEIAAVKHLDYLSDVWCLTVPGYEEFSLSNGALVHNSSHGADAMRAAATAHKIGLLMQDIDMDAEDDGDHGDSSDSGRNSLTGY